MSSNVTRYLNKASRPSQPKRFDTLRATVVCDSHIRVVINRRVVAQANLKRLGRTKDAVEKEMRLNQMELDYWHRSPGCAFEDKARAEIARLESEEFAAEAAEKDAYRKKMVCEPDAVLEFLNACPDYYSTCDGYSGQDGNAIEPEDRR